MSNPLDIALFSFMRSVYLVETLPNIRRIDKTSLKFEILDIRSERCSVSLTSEVTSISAV